MPKAQYGVDGVVWYRCPGEVTYPAHKPHSDSGLLDGCFLYVGLKDFRWKVGGRVHCAHCGGHAQQVPASEVAPAGKLGSANPAVFVVERVPVGVLKDRKFDASRYDWGCCMNKNCSQHYLEANAVDSDAITTDARVGTGGRVHSATQ